MKQNVEKVKGSEYFLNALYLTHIYINTYISHFEVGIILWHFENDNAFLM
jgi:hypothetical protein